jgi:hypothetical protein
MVTDIIRSGHIKVQNYIIKEVKRMRFHKLYERKIFTIAIALIAGIIAGSFTFSSIPILANKPSQPIIVQEMSSPKFEVNKNGETYGSIKDITVAGQEPTLIHAEGIDGTVGYVRFIDLNGPQPKNPEEAVAYMEKMKNSAPKNIPLYDVDGKTVIGEFKIDVPKGFESTGKIMQDDIIKKIQEK